MATGEINQSLLSWARKNLTGIVDDENYARMISGLSFNPWEANLVAARLKASETSFRLSTLRLDDFSGPLEFYHHRQGSAKSLIGKHGDGFTIEPFQAEYGFNVSVGKNFYVNRDAKFLDSSIIRFGDDIDIGPNVTFCTLRHPAEFDSDARKQTSVGAFPITVGDKVWFGANALILGGVTIGDRAVIAAGSIVTHDVPPDVVFGGRPGRVLRNIDN